MKRDGKSKVALAKGGRRAGNIDAALRLIEGDTDLGSASNVFVKVNFVSVTNQLAATHVDAVRSVLRFLRERYEGKITVGESTIVPAQEGYVNYGYHGLEAEFGVQLVDLNEGGWVQVDVYDSNLEPMKLRFARGVAESDYRVVVGPPKTHDVVGVTLSIKNLGMGSLFYRVKTGSGGAVRNLLRAGYRHIPSRLRSSGRVARLRDTAAVYAGGDKRKMHQGFPVHNLNLYLLAEAYPPHLSVIDGFTGMDGAGPEAGAPVDWGIAVASQDPVAADCLTARLMGFDVSDIGYLWYCKERGLGAGDLAGMEILGSDPGDCIRQFRPHPTFEAQKGWRDERISGLLGI